MPKNDKTPKVPKSKDAPKGTYSKRAEDCTKCKCPAPPTDKPK